MATVRSAAALAVLILGHSLPAVLGQTCVGSQETALCIKDQYEENGGNGQLQCTAEDLSDASLEIIAIEDNCDGPSGTTTFTAKLTVTANAAQIFDIGLFIPTAGQGDAMNGDCEIYAFECQEDPDDGDMCGDVAQGSTTFNPIEIEVPCTAEQEINFCVAWAVGVGQQPTDECNAPADATPSNPAKCKCGTIALPQCSDPGVMCKDPILQGLRGQYVKWVGEEGAWYALFLDEDIDTQVNVRPTGPMPEDFPDRQYITGVSILSQGHSLVFEVIDPYTGETPGCPDGLFPCLVDGGIRILVDGEETSALLSPTRDEKIVDTFEVSSSNLPTECREFGGGEEWAHVFSNKRRDERELAEPSFEDWVMRFPHMVAPQWCAKYISEKGLDDVQSKQSVIRISTPDLTVRFSIGVNHRSGGKVDRFGRELPELDFWQTSVALIGVDSNNEHLTGMLGETARPVQDKNGHTITKGLDALRGTVADYRVSGPLGMDFALLHE